MRARRTEAGTIQPDIRVIGTAGHVDHGKSTLISALTGVHPDRLKEEQAREMTIDLGFGWLTLPTGRDVGIVDVPGHRDFVGNMLAGVAGIDAVWLVVAADEGVMPQTLEHLAIVDLLGIRGGLLVLTKTDLVSDTDWLEAVESDVRAAVRGTTLEHARIIRVSARTGQGLADLLDSTEALLDELPARANLSRPRLPVDRVFTMEGFGTVVTGTLCDGDLSVGDEVEFLPSGRRARVRGLQNHRRQVDSAAPGSRTAVNVTGVSAEDLRRGEVLTHPGQYVPARRVDARVRLLAAASTGLAHDCDTKLFIGASETIARVRLLGVESLRPGEEGWIQLETRDPVVCARGDGFILRLPSPAETIGGGRVVEPHPQKRHKRFDPEVLRNLQALIGGAPTDILLETAMSLGLAPARELVQLSRLGTVAAAAALHQLLNSSRLLALGAGGVTVDSETLVVSAQDIDSISRRTDRAIADFHARFPLRRGMPREELRNELGLEARSFPIVLEYLEAAGKVVATGGMVARAGHEPHLTPDQRAAVDSLLLLFESNPSAPPSVKECTEAIGAELFAALRDQGLLVTVSTEVVFTGVRYAAMVETLKAELDRRGQLTLADVRDLFGTSRRYAQALLEHLDRIGVTRRTGDARTLTAGASSRPD